MLSPEDQAAIDKARALQVKIDKLYAKQDALLEPLATAAVESKSKERVEALVLALPGGFYRSELRTLTHTDQYKAEFK